MSGHTHRLIALALLILCSLPATGLAQAADPQPGAAQAPTSSVELQRAWQAVERDGYTASRLWALGKAQLAQDRLGPAIVSIERGLMLSPRDPALREALSAARTRAGLSAPQAASWLSRAAQMLSLREWSFAAWACCLAVSLALLGVTLARRHRRLLVTALLSSGLALALTGGEAYAARQRLATAYVLRADSVLRQSPFENAAVLGQLRPGEAVDPQSAHDGFVYVRSERGQSGWIREDELAQLAPMADSPS